MTSHLFVYGTLLSGIGHPMHEVLTRYASLQGTGYINGKLYDLGNYPGLILSNSASKIVWGEIYQVEDEAELYPYLDEYEGCASHSQQPHEYQRDLVSLHNSEAQSLLAWTYLFKMVTNDSSIISGGDYLAYRNKGALKIVNNLR